MTWELFLGIIEILGFMVIVVPPIVKLNSNITRLNCILEAQRETDERHEKRLNAHSESIKDHERRITRLEEHTADE